MPSVTEHDNWRLTKEKDDVERYLLRIIQRFFEVEVNYSKESIEAIIVESMQRLKRWLYTDKGFIFSFNNKTGHLIIDISFFGGERAFNKNSAFNKNFGNKADTICEGNDPRLNDAREPLTHHHEIDDIESLRERIEAMVFGDGGYYHIHKNKKVLDMLSYTGSKVQIDLILVEWLVERVEDYYGHLQSLQMGVKRTYDDTIDTLENKYRELILLLQDIREYENTAITWLDEAYKYINTRIEIYNNNIMSQFVYYFTKERYDVIHAIYKKAFQIFGDDEIPIHDGSMKITPVQTGEMNVPETEAGDSMKEIYDYGIRIGNDDWSFNDGTGTFIYGHNESHEYQIFASMSMYDEYWHRVCLTSYDTDNDCIGVVLAYDPNINKHLSLVCIGGTGSGGSTVCPYTAQHDGKNAFWAITDDYNPIDDSFEFKELTGGIIGEGLSWNLMMVSVLIHREGSHFDIWVTKERMPASWFNEDSNGNILPDTLPTVSFNADDYATLSWVSNNPLRYGYSNHSQKDATYLSAYFVGKAKPIGKEIGHTDIVMPGEQNLQTNNHLSANGKFKMFFRYEDDNGDTHTTPMPFLFKKNGQTIVLKTIYDQDGNIKVVHNINISIPYYFTKQFIHGGYLYYAVDNRHTHLELIAGRYPLITVQNSQELEFLKTNFVDNTNDYYIQGIFSNNDFTHITDIDGNQIPYIEWTPGHPREVNNINGAIAIDAHTGKMKTKETTAKSGFIGKTPCMRLSEMFHNPRIYYQVIGNEEV